MTRTHLNESACAVAKHHFIDTTTRPQPCTDEVAEETCLPASFPLRLTTGQVWKPSELANDRQYIVNLSNEDKVELDDALEAFLGLCIDGDLVDRSNFPLLRLQHTLSQVARDIHDGKGFCVVRGLEPNRYSVDDGTIVFLGIQSYVAERRMRQDEAGNMLVHIVSEPSDTRLSKHVRYSTDTIPFHTDPDADVVGFQTRSVAAEGGRCVLSSGHSIYNELVRIRPDIVCILARPDWHFALPYHHTRPVLFYHNSRIIFSFTRLALLGNEFYPRPTAIPSLTPLQKEALDILNTVAEKNRIEFDLQPGDIHFVNNLALLHRRDRFVDDDEHTRHLVRMHLRNEELGWDIPGDLSPFWDDALDESRDESWHIEPMPEGFFPLKLGSH